MSPIEQAAGANNEILESFVARNGPEVGRLMQATWMVVRHHNSLMSIMRDCVDAESFKVAHEAVAEPLAAMLALFPRDKVDEAQKTIVAMGVRHINGLLAPDPEEDNG